MEMQYSKIIILGPGVQLGKLKNKKRVANLSENWNVD